MNEFIKTLWERRSVRKYKSDPIPDEDLNLILETARRAPTGGNRQKWQMIVIKDEEQRRKVAAACANQLWMADAPVILCPVAYPDEGKTNMTIVLDQAILAATSLGYGTCWIGAMDADEVKAVLNIPADAVISNLTPVGVPDQSPEFRGRKARAELFLAGAFDGEALDFEIE